VINLERTNIRQLSRETLGAEPDMAVIDISFISLKKVLPSVISLLKARADILCLIKPQFEAPKNSVGKGGIIRDATQQQAIIKDLVLYARNIHLFVAGVTESPILGQKGNREFFMYLKKQTQPYIKKTLQSHTVPTV
jgi:23S rRNA (cytidine1920-2'-O)/16S rRNA (cytidine1409-2'-O)-methyltransferase